ncbi:MAG TPA: magnesium transporter [Rectinemataceae bacterium]|nr:magnesium transporter [Rectinemataceae bacterium]
MLDQLLAPDLKNLLEAGKNDNIHEFLDGMHPTTIAEILTGMDPEETLDVLRIIGEPGAADAFRELPAAYQIDVSDLLDTADMARLIVSMEPDDRVDLLKAIPREKFEALLPILAKRERDDIMKLSQFAESTAGSVMTSEYIALNQDLTVKDAIERIRLEGAKAHSIFTIFVMDAARILKGSVNLADLILANPDKRLSEIMDPRPQSINALNYREEAVYLFSRYDLVSLPVVDADDVMIGLITHDDIIDVLEQEQTEDMERFMAITGSHDNIPYLHTSIWSHFRNRIGWLVILALLGLISGAVVQSFEQTIANLMILAFYMPMLTSTGGNTGSQSAAVIVRSLALKEILPKDGFKVIWKELRVALLLGVVLGVLAFARVLLAAPASRMLVPGAITALDIGFAIGIALALQVVASTVIGAALPLGAAVLGADPALIASPALATIVDITGLLIYFTTARMILRI